VNWLTTSTGGGGVVVADADQSEQPGAGELRDHLAVDGDGGGRHPGQDYAHGPILACFLYSGP
jgi:hypothetical protein